MAKKSAIEKNNRRARMIKQYAARRQALKKVSRDRTLTPEDRFAAQLKLAELPRNSSPSRWRLRCEITGRPRANYRKFKVCRIVLRDLAGKGHIPGVVKSSW